MRAESVEAGVVGWDCEFRRRSSSCSGCARRSPPGAEGEAKGHHARRDQGGAGLARHRRLESAIWTMLGRLGLTHRKKSLRAAEQDRPNVASRRTLWKLRQRFMNSSAFVFLDETGALTNMVHQYGWGPNSDAWSTAAPSRSSKATWRNATTLRPKGLYLPSRRRIAICCAPGKKLATGGSGDRERTAPIYRHCFSSEIQV